jgi:peroxin-1
MLLQAITTWFDQSTSIQHPLVTNNGTVVNCFVKHDFRAEFLLTFSRKNGDESNKRHAESYCLMNSSIFKSISVTLKEPLGASEKSGVIKLPIGDISQVDHPLPAVMLNQLVVQHEVLSAARFHIDVCLGQRPSTNHMTSGLRAGSLLLCGTRGVGKTVLSNALCREAATGPNHAFVLSIDCKMLRGKKPESIAAHIQAAFDEAAWRQPSVILLDDLDQIAMACSGPDQEMSGEAVYHAKIALGSTFLSHIGFT